MDRARQSRSVNVQALEQALVLAETALELKERSDIAAKQVNILREASLKSHRSCLALRNSSRKLLTLAKSLIENPRNAFSSPILNYNSNFEECRQRLASILDQHLNEDRESEKTIIQNIHLDFIQRLRILEEIYTKKALSSSYSSYSRLHARNPCRMDDKYPSGYSHRDNFLEMANVGLPTVQEYGLSEFDSIHTNNST